ncbi:hypothetical protein [Peribacillus frigoritolerans]|uniref:hypothetical protein n=1 Tax=Peribacillus frigoritolerans TaxID=450367 RepID=UPI003431678E
MSRFWKVNLGILVVTAIIIGVLLSFTNNLHIKDYLITICLSTALHFLIALILLTLYELKRMTFNFSMVFGIVLILAAIIIVLSGWENSEYLLHNAMVSLSLLAYGLSLKDLIDYIDEDKDDTEKYFKGWITLIIIGFISFMIVAVRPVAEFVNDTNTDIFTLISLGLVLVTISVKQNVYNMTNRPSLPPIKSSMNKAIKKLNKEETAELEKHILSFLENKKKL